MFTGDYCQYSEGLKCEKLEEGNLHDNSIVAKSSMVDLQRIKVKIESEAKKGRYFKSISIGPHIDCQFPGENFNKIFDSTSCQDVIQGEFLLDFITKVTSLFFFFFFS